MLWSDTLRRGQLITNFHRWNHCCSNQTQGAGMLERHHNIRWHAHVVKTQTVKQTGETNRWRPKTTEDDWKLKTPAQWKIVKVSHKLSQCYQRINLQQITPPCNVFFSNSHQRLVTSLRGSAQILQQTEQCSAIPGYIRLSTATVHKLEECKLSSVPACVHVLHRNSRHC